MKSTTIGVEVDIPSMANPFVMTAHIIYMLYM